MLEYISKFINKDLGVDYEISYQIIRKIHPFEIAINNKINFLWLRKITTSMEKTTEDLEFLICSSLTGLLDFSEAEQILLGKLIFYESNETFVSLAKDEYANLCRNQVISGKLNYFFHVYQPKSSISLRRWLGWFAALKDENDEGVSNRIGAVIDGVFELRLGRGSIEDECAACIQYNVENLSKLFPLVRFIIDSILHLEKTTSMHLRDSIQSSCLTDIIRAFPDANNMFHADIIVAILKAIRKKTNPSWKTPLARLVETLVKCGRIDEAMEVGGNQGLTLGKLRLPLNQYIDGFKGTKRSTPEYSIIFENVADAFVRTWAFCLNSRRS